MWPGKNIMSWNMSVDVLAVAVGAQSHQTGYLVEFNVVEFSKGLSLVA